MIYLSFEELLGLFHIIELFKTGNFYTTQYQ